MSFRPVFGRSSAVASVWTRSSYFGSMSIVTMARPSLRSTLAMSPMRTPGDADRLALARRDRLRGRELGLERERRRLAEREAQALVGEDVAADAGRDGRRARRSRRSRARACGSRAFIASASGSGAEPGALAASVVGDLERQALAA